MKLYNLFEDIIFEELGKTNGLITEGVSDDEVDKAINGKYNVNIMYQDPGQSAPSKRYIQVYNRGVSKKKEGGGGGNAVIRAYQIFGGSKTTPTTGAWKIFRLDRIVGWYPTNMKWKKPISDTNIGIPDYNANGDRTFASVNHKVDASTFGGERSNLPNKNDNELNNEI